MKFILLENNPAYQKLVTKEIAKKFSDYELVVIDNRDQFINIIPSLKPDIIISNISISDIDALTALNITHKYYPLLPFIVYSEKENKNEAIKFLKAGAYEYLSLKNIKKLSSIIDQATIKYYFYIKQFNDYEKIKSKEEKFRLLVENAKDLIYRYELVPVRGFTYVSPSATEITGYTPEDHYNDPDLGFKIVHPDDRHLLEKIARGEISLEKPLILRWVKKDGTIFWTEQRNTPIFDNKGNLVAIEGIARDITELKKYEELLKENEFRFRTITDAISDYSFMVDVNENLEFFNVWFSDSFYKNFGYSKEEVFDSQFILEKLIPPEEHKKLYAALDAALSGKPVKLGLKVITKSKETRFVRLIAHILKTLETKNYRIFGVAEDLTSKRNYELQLKQTKRFMQSLIDSLPAEVAVLDDSGNIIMINKAWYEFGKNNYADLNDIGIGVNYISVCENAKGKWSEEAKSVCQALKDMIIGKIDYFEIDYPCHSNKEKRWFKLITAPFKIDDTLYIVVLHTNITNLIKLQQEISERKEQFENLAESTNTAIFVYQGENFVYVNSAACRITGYSKEELLNKKFWELVHPEFRELVKERGLKRQTGEKVPTSYEFKIISKDGTEKWIDFTGALISWFGQAAGLGTAFDITQLKSALDKVIRTEERFRILFESAPLGIMLEDENGNILSVNKEYEKITGYTREELLGQNVKMLAADGNTEKIKENISRILSGEVLEQIVHSIRKDGKIIFVRLIETCVELSDGEIGILSICEDMTEKIQIENALKESEKKFRTIFETANEGICIIDKNDLITNVNSKFCQMVGYEPQEILYKNFLNLFYEEEDKDLANLRKRWRMDGKPTSFEIRLKTKNEDLIWVYVSATGLFDESGEFIGSFAFFTDITEKKKLEDELKKSEEQFRLIWENSKEAMRLTDEDGRIILVNPAFCKLVNMARKQLEGKFINVIYPEIKREYILSKHKERFKTGKIKEYFETEVTLHDGRKVWFEVSNSFINFRGKKLLLGIFRDITERKKLINELIRAKEEAEEANRLKSGFISMMSHEIRTPLNVILGFSSVLRELFGDKNEEINSYFDAIQNSGKRLLNTILQILDFSRIEAKEFELHLKKFDLNAKTLEAVNQLSVLAKEKSIEFDLQLQDKIPYISADEYCLDGIIINLINNAIKFSHDNSKIEIKTELEGRFVKLVVKDYGIGMSEEYQKFLFQPFSQEKVGYNRPYEGTGLGLALTKKFVEMLKGKIECDSKKGIGTTFIVYFPL